MHDLDCFKYDFAVLLKIAACVSVCLFEYPVKVVHIRKTTASCNFNFCQVVILNHIICKLHSVLIYIFNNSLPCDLFEETAKIVFAQPT